MANQADLSVRTMCRVLGVSASGFYAWRERAPSQRSIANAVMTERIRQIHQDSYESYGMPRVRAELIEQGVCISRQRVARLMRQAGIHGISKRTGFTVTTRRDKRQTPAHDMVNRRFHATGPNQLWVADMTYVPTWMGFLYLAVVIDVWSRRVVGWAMGERMTADLVLAALNMALEQRKPKGVIHHSDQGSQYTSLAFGERCKQMQVRPSMGTVGDAYDNALAENFFASLEAELIERNSFQSKAQARMAVFTWIEGWYNPRRRHSGLGYLSPLTLKGASKPCSMSSQMPTCMSRQCLKRFENQTTTCPPKWVNSNSIRPIEVGRQACNGHSTFELRGGRWQGTAAKGWSSLSLLTKRRQTTADFARLHACGYLECGRVMNSGRKTRLTGDPHCFLRRQCLPAC